MQQLMPYLMDVRGFTLMVLGFCFLIFVHELGHFIAAKAVDMKVTQFALGMGPALFAWRKGIGFRKGSTEPEFDKRINAHFAAREKEQIEFKEKTAADRKPTPAQIDQAARELGLGETEYRVNWLVVLGGYVKMLGQEDLKPEAISDDARSFTHKPAWARAIVLSAGVTMNLIFGIIFFIVAFMAGVKMPPAIAGEIVPKSPAAEAYALGHEGDPAFKGIRLGDHIVKVDGKDITDYTDLTMAAALTNPGDAMDVTVERAGVSQPLTFHLTPTMIPGEKFLSIGVETLFSLVVHKPEDESIPLLDKVADGSRITAVGDQPVETFAQFTQILGDAHGNPMPVTFTAPDGQKTTISLHALPLLPIGDNGSPSLLGLVPAARVDQIVVHSPADDAGIQPGDLIARLGSQSWPWMQKVTETVAADHGRPLDLVVWREGKEIELPATAPGSNGRLGIVVQSAEDAPIIAYTMPSSPLAGQDLPGGSRLVSINGKPVKSLIDLAQHLANAPDGPINIVYQKNLKDAKPTAVSVNLTAAQRLEICNIQWVAPSLPYDMLRVPLAASDPLGATRLGFKKTWQFMIQTYLTLLRMVEGHLPASEVRGAVGIAQMGTHIANVGWSYLLFFLGLISVNLVVMNFLPIPILDGGQMLFLLIEKLKGSPLSIRAQSIATYVGLAIIGSLLLMTLYFDVGRLIHGG